MPCPPRVHDADLAGNRFTSHVGSDASSVRDRVDAQGYASSWIYWNCHMTGNADNGAQVAFDKWINRTPHRNNLLSPNCSGFRVEYAYESNSGYDGCFVVVFARPG